MTTVAPRDQRAGTREWLGLAVLALPTLLVSMDVSVLHLAGPAITLGLGASAQQTLWIIDIYGFMIAGLLVTMGGLGDRIGRRKLLLIGAAAFGAASVLAALSTTPEMLLLSRAALGIAGATLMPSTLSLISAMFADPRQRGMAIGLWVTMFSAGIALGPVIGGALLQVFWWGSVFLIAVPVMMLLLVTGPLVLPEYRAEQAGPLDPVSVVLSLGAILPVVYGLKELATGGEAVVAAIAILAGAALGVMFCRRQRRLTTPLLDLALFRNRAFSTAAAAMLVAMLVAGGTYLYVTQYLQLALGQPPMTAGLWLLPAALALIVTSMAAPALAGRFAPSHVVAAGLTLSLVGHLMLATVGPDSGLWLAVVGFTLTYAGGGPLIALGTDLIVGSSPQEKAGSAAAVSETSTELGLALGVAILGALGTFVYRTQMSTSPAADLGRDFDTFAATIDAAGSLPPAQGAELVAAGTEAFVSALSTIGLVSAVLSAGLAVAILLGLRRSAA
jgi:DHA2 family multidrug resistance protein-like MFS transporter